jgi:hypothetical protein
VELVAPALGAVALATALVAILRRGDGSMRAAAGPAALACAAAWAANVAITSTSFVEVLQLDAWESVSLVEHLRDGAFRFGSLWAAHNEHRPLTGRLVAMACAQVTDWNHWWEFGALHVVAALQVLVFAWYGARPGPAWRLSPAVLVAVASCFVATMHWETWLRGFSVHILLGVLAPSVAFLTLASHRAGWLTVLVAAAATMVGEMSFGASLLAWPLGAAVIALRGQEQWRGHLLAWVFIGSVATLLYLPGLEIHPGATANVAVAFGPTGLVRILAGALVTIGMAAWYAPALFDGGAAWAQAAVVAAAGLAVLAWVGLLVRHWQHDTGRERVWLFPAALGAFGLGACLLVSAGRVAGGLHALAASRYLIFAACFWASCLLLLGLHRERGRPVPRVRAWGLALAVVAAMLANSIAAVPYMAREASRARQARQQLTEGDVGAAAHVLYPDPYKLAHMREVLRRHELSVFRRGAP